MLKFKNVSKSFGDIVALVDTSFEIKDGEFVFVTGPSGAGKTTLLNLILKIYSPDTGSILLDNTDISKIKNKEIPKIRQQIGVVFQDFKVLSNRTLRENIEVALAVIGIPQKEWRDRVDHVLELVGLSDRDELFPSQLSGGELQRVSLARALVVNPKIILADEPTGNLDWETTVKLLDLFETINKEGKTIIMATHHERILGKLKKRVIVLTKHARAKKATVKNLDDKVGLIKKEKKKKEEAVIENDVKGDKEDEDD